MRFVIPGAVWSRAKRGHALAFVAAALLSGQAQADTLRFEQAFSTRDEPAVLHFHVGYGIAGREHRLEVWRDGQQRLRRRTDETIDTFVSKPADSPEWSMSVLDHQRRIHTRISRTNLFRIGNFTDWFDLAHGLKHPFGAYTLKAEAAPAAAPKPVERCAWYLLEAGASRTHVCWSRRVGLPLVMLDAQRAVVWRVTALDTGPLPGDVFAIRDSGYVANQADEDVEPD